MATTKPAKKPAPKKKPAAPAPRPSRKAPTSSKAKPAPKPKRGRPPRSAEAATAAILVRLTHAEKAKLEAAAERAGKSLSAHLRDAALAIS